MFEDVTVGMIFYFFFLLSVIFEVLLYLNYVSVSVVFSMRQEEKQMPSSVAAELKSALTFLFTAHRPRNGLFRRFLVFFRL